MGEAKRKREAGLDRRTKTDTRPAFEKRAHNAPTGRRGWGERRFDLTFEYQGADPKLQGTDHKVPHFLHADGKVYRDGPNGGRVRVNDPEIIAEIRGLLHAELAERELRSRPRPKPKAPVINPAKVAPAA